MIVYCEPSYRALTALAAKLGLPETELQRLLDEFSTQQRRLFLFLAEREVAQTDELRMQLNLGNPSFVATAVNRRLEAAGDPRRILCLMHAHRTRGATWRLANVTAANDAQREHATP